MTPTNYAGDIIPQDAADDDSSFGTNADNTVGEADIEEILYGGEHSPKERLSLLRTLRGNISEREASDFGDGDPQALLDEIDERIAELESDDETGNIAFDADPLAHRETLSPDSDELEALEEEDEESLDDEDEGDLDNDDNVAR